MAMPTPSQVARINVIIDELHQPLTLENAQRRAQIAREAIELIGPEGIPRFLIRLYIQLGSAAGLQPDGSIGPDYDDKIGALEKGLDLAMRHGQYDDEFLILSLLGGAYEHRPTGDVAENR